MASVVTVSAQTADDLDALVASGSFPSREAAVAEGIRRLQEQQAWLRMVDEKVAQGRAEIAAGRSRPATDVFDELEDRYRRWPR